MKLKYIVFTLIFSLLLLTGITKAHAADWPMYMHDISHTSNQADEVGLSTSNVSSLTKLWSYKTGGVIAAQPIVVGSYVYIGSWDGNMYAFNRDTGTVLWKTFVGITTSNATGCYPNKAGVTSSAQIYNGVLYVAGGDQYFYALDPTTGNILWKVSMFTSQVQGDYYNYATAGFTNVNGVPYAFIGVSSLCDNPLVQGQLLKINLTTQTVQQTLNIVPTGQTGGGIWYTPAIDTTSNPPTIYVPTGTPQAGQLYSKAILAINADTMQIISSWQVPDSELLNTPDPDFGSSAVLFTTQNNTKLVAAAHKNGILYALNTQNLAAGPVWRATLATGGQCPQCGDGSIVTPVFDNVNNLLYAAGGKDPSASTSAGEVRAIDPATGTIKWTHDDFTGHIIADMAYTNGVLIYATTKPTNTLVALDASSGTQLFSYSLPAGAFGAPSISNGMVFIGDTAGNVFAFSVPGLAISPTPTPTPVQCTNTITPGAASVTSTVTLPQSGIYTIWSRIQSQDTNSNAYFVQVDGGCPIDVGDLSSMPSNTWTWINYQNGNTQNQISLNLTSGQHTVVMSANKANTKLDRVIFTTDFSCIPTDTGDNCVNPITPTPTPTPTLGPTPTPTPIPTGWSAEYFSNQNLTGTPAITRVDPTINFNWNGGSPDPAIPNTHFSARWTSTQAFTGGTYQFTMTTDDGGRLYIDGTKVIDAWIDQPPTTYTTYQTLSTGNHTIVMEYYQDLGGDVAQLSFQSVAGTPTPTAIPTPIPAPIGQYSAEYFSNQNLTGTPAITRVDPTINFNWNGGSPDPAIPNTHFSARWTGVQTFQAQSYTFTVTCDDGCRLLIDGTNVLDKWIDQPPTTYTVIQSMTAGNHTIVMEYYQDTGGDVAQLSFQ